MGMGSLDIVNERGLSKWELAYPRMGRLLELASVWLVMFFDQSSILY